MYVLELAETNYFVHQPIYGCQDVTFLSLTLTFKEGKHIFDMYGCQEIFYIKIMVFNVSRSGTGSLR